MANNLLMLAERENRILGSDFLTWMFYRSETGQNVFEAPMGESFMLSMECKLTLEGGEGEVTQVVNVGGTDPDMTAVRAHLLEGKKVTKARFRLTKDVDEWFFVLSGEKFCLSGFKTPKIDNAKDDDAGFEPVVLERTFLLERGFSFLDTAFKTYLDLRLSADWWAEVVRIKSWISEA